MARCRFMFPWTSLSRVFPGALFKVFLRNLPVFALLINVPPSVFIQPPLDELHMYLAILFFDIFHLMFTFL